MLFVVCCLVGLCGPGFACQSLQPIFSIALEERFLMKNKNDSPVSLSGGLQFGFSLVELMIVIAIFAVLAAIAIPNIIRYRENTQLRSSATELLGTFRKAQFHAVKNNQNTTLDIVSGATGTVTVKDSGGNTLFVYRVHPGSKIDNKFANTPGYTPQGLPINGVLGSIEVLPDGSNSKIAYKVALSMAGHTKLQTSTNGGTTWK